MNYIGTRDRLGRILPLVISRTDGCREMGEAMLERSQGDDSKPHYFFLNCHVSVQGQTKWPNITFPQLEQLHYFCTWSSRI